ARTNVSVNRACRPVGTAASTFSPTRRTAAPVAMSVAVILPTVLWARAARPARAVRRPAASAASTPPPTRTTAVDAASPVTVAWHAAPAPAAAPRART